MEIGRRRPIRSDILAARVMVDGPSWKLIGAVHDSSWVNRPQAGTSETVRI
jgi:hypothetical protein